MATRLRTTDLIQHKPGRFVLDRCEGCRHTFQNPRLSEAGLEFYYRDFYDGLGQKQLAMTFASRTKTYVQRAESLVPFAPTPKNWLDVGTGHGHFCEAARTVFPDMSSTASTSPTAPNSPSAPDAWTTATGASRAGRATRPPTATTSSACSTTWSTARNRPARFRRRTWPPRPGGHLLIEVPDPDSRYARLLGRWCRRAQPEHLHFVPVENLRARLTDLGFTVVAEQHAEPHDPVDLLAAVWLALDAVAPRDGSPPWPPVSPSRLQRILRAMTVIAGIPALLLGRLLDRLVVKRVARPLGLSNAYRLVARRD